MKRVVKIVGFVLASWVGLIIVIIILALIFDDGDDSPAAPLPVVSTSTPTVTPVPTSTPIPPTPTPTFDQARVNSSIVTYDDLFRNIETHVGKQVYFEGEVISVNELQENNYLLRVNVTKSEFGFWSDDIRLDYRGSRLLDDDVIEFIGEIKGLWEYTTVLGASRTIPHLESYQVQLLQK